MEIMVPYSDFNEDSVAIQLVNELEREQIALALGEASLYHQFPMFREIDESLEFPSFTLVSPNHGLVVIQIDNRSNRSINDTDLTRVYERTEQMYSSLFSRLIKVPILRARRNSLVFEFNTIVYLPNYQTEIPTHEDVIATNSLDKLKIEIEKLKTEPLSKEIVEAIYATIEGTSALPKPQDRDIADEDANTKGAILEKLEIQIATFDQKQKYAALNIVDGPQRIRGLAGSGKTIVLTMKAALMHIKNPEAKILYTFYTKSLYDQIKQLITRFYRVYKDVDPNWDNIVLRHAWGGQNLPGVYYDACIDNSVIPTNLAEAKSFAKKLKMNDFEYVCYDLLRQKQGEIKKKYDYVLMDEGQDSPASFYWLCRKLVKNDCLVWAYDELQNILDIKLQKTETWFENDFGDKGIDLAELQRRSPRQNNDIVLHKTYRNPRETLIVAHAIGFGVYNNKVLQRLENKEHWEDLGYTVLTGACEAGEYTEIERPKENSPSIISESQSIDEMIEYYQASGYSAEMDWICKSIIKDIHKENLLPEDIMVISLDDRNARTYFKDITSMLAEHDIYTNNIIESFKGDRFIVKNQVSLSTVYRAKGNEAGVVYVIGADSIGGFNFKDNINTRNKLFTAFTRTKGWLRISGIGTSFNYLIKEIEQAKQNLPLMKFVYPAYDEINTLRRELAKENAENNRRYKELQRKLEELGIDSEEAIQLLKLDKKQ